MGFAKPADKIKFADERTEEAFNHLSEESPLKRSIRKVIENLKGNAFCGELIKKELIPKIYIKEYGIDNLWWYPLTKGWRLVYSLTGSAEVGIIAIIIEYFDHKNYERRFGY